MHLQVSFVKGEVVTGTVVQFEPTGALVDIGAKATAYMPAREVRTDKKCKLQATSRKPCTNESKVSPGVSSILRALPVPRQGRYLARAGTSPEPVPRQGRYLKVRSTLHLSTTLPQNNGAVSRHDLRLQLVITDLLPIVVFRRCRPSNLIGFMLVS